MWFIGEHLNIFITNYKKIHSKIHLKVKVFFGEKEFAILFQSNPFGS